MFGPMYFQTQAFPKVTDQCHYDYRTRNIKYP